MKQLRWRSLLALAGALALGLCAGASAQRGEKTAGLIVRLKSAPAHESLEPHGKRGSERELAQSLSANESARWSRVIGKAGLHQSPRMRPAGRDQQLLEFDQPLSRAELEVLRERLLRRPEVDWVEPNRRERRLQAAPSDPLFGGSDGQWWLHGAGGSNANSIEARLRGVAGFQAAWLRADFAPVTVAVLDTGITTHPDLVNRVLPGYDFVREAVYANDGDGRDADPSDPGDWVDTSDLRDPNFDGCATGGSSWHGTVISGMVAANTDNGIGGTGVHRGALVLPVRVAGKCGADVADIVDGMRWAAGLAVAGVPPNPNPTRIVNISFGGGSACGQAYQTAIDELRALGVVVVAAAGNEWGAPSRPANCNGVVGVAGLNRDGFKSNYSNFGAQLAASGIATVSGDDAAGAWGSVLADTGLVTLTNLGGTFVGAAGYARHYGTSFATPQVSGTIAMMLGLNPQLSHEQILAGLRASARPHVGSPRIGACSAGNPGRCICSTATCGAGILDADQALAYAALPSAYVPPARQSEIIDNRDIDAALALAPQDRVVPVPPPAAGEGGGAFGGLWLLALAAGCLALVRVRGRTAR
jgi:serine protease